MKHFLILTLLYLTVGCKNINSTSNDPNVRNMPFDNSVYLNIPHLEDQSLLRRKLLNLELAVLLKSTNEIDTNSKIKNGDEFKFIDESYKPSSVNISEYKNLKSNAAEVIVSYKDHLEIYFVPTGIERKKAFEQLRVVAEEDASFTWIDSTDKFLQKDKVYYLLSASKVNLKENDKYFNQEKISLGDYFNEKIYSFQNNQILELEVNIDYSQEETSLALMDGQAYKCSRAAQESGCDSCNYKLEVGTGVFSKKILSNSELVDLDIIINGRKYPFQELNPIKAENGNFKVILDLKKLILTDRASVQIYQNIQFPVLKTVKAIEVGSRCVNKNVINTINLTPIVKMNINLNVKGRALNLSI